MDTFVILDNIYKMKIRCFLLWPVLLSLTQEKESDLALFKLSQTAHVYSYLSAIKRVLTVHSG